MDKLFKGVLEFRQEDFEKQKALFNRLGRRQRPHTLFIGCSDSRVVPSLITRTNPGELFVVRNIANTVPPNRTTDEFAGTQAAVEYAVQALEVDSIVVCGHSNCGGCEAMNLPSTSLEHLPHTRKWLEISAEVPVRVARLMKGESAEEREFLTEQVNILVQMRNLLTYPYIKDKVAAGDLRILGWYYIIDTGEVFNFNDETGHFELVE